MGLFRTTLQEIINFINARNISEAKQKLDEHVGRFNLGQDNIIVQNIQTNLAEFTRAQSAARAALNVGRTNECKENLEMAISSIQRLENNLKRLISEAKIKLE